MKDIAEDSADESQSLRYFAGTPEAYIDLISDEWDWNYGTMFVTEMSDNWMKRFWEVQLITGGWSGNEETLERIEGSFFHCLFWEAVHRGGKHVYHVPSARWREHFEKLGEL